MQDARYRFRHEDIPELKTAGGNVIPLADLLDVDPDNLAKEYEVQAGWVATIGFSHAQAKIETEMIERQLYGRRAEVSLELRANSMKLLKTVKPTVDQVKDAVSLDPEVKELEEQLATATAKETLLDVARHAIRTKGEMIIQLGADLRIDRKSDPT